MKKTTLLSTALVAGLCLMPMNVCAQSSEDVEQDVVTMITNKAAGEELTFRVNSGTFTIDWGDGTPVEIKSTGDPITGSLKGTTVTIASNKISYLDCSSSGLTSLKVNEAPYLKVLDCSDNNLTEVGVQSNGYLEELDCSGNELTYISLSTQRNLKTLNCSNNEMTTLSFSNAKGLKILICNDNKLSNLSFSGLSSLETVWCYNNNLKTLNLSSNTNLQSVVCDGNQLTEISTANNGANIVDFWCNDNQLQSLNLSKGTGLETLSCANNQLSGLSLAALSGHKALAVYLQNNKLGFSDFYSTGNVADYIYGPQQKVSLSTNSVDVKKAVTLPDYQKNVDGSLINPSYNWFNSLTGEELEYGQTKDYISILNNFLFQKPFESIYCVITSDLYPDIELVTESLTVSDPTGVNDINNDNGLVCQGRDGLLHLSADKATFVRIFASDGKQVWSGTVTDTSVCLNLGHGIFLVNGIKVSL